MNGCISGIDINANKALTELQKMCGTNVSQFYKYLGKVVKATTTTGSLEFTDDFKNWWKDTAKMKSELDINKTNPNTLKNKIIQYFDEKVATFEAGVRKSTGFDKVGIFGYDSIATRELGKRLFANRMILHFHKLQSQGIKVDNPFITCATEAIDVFRNILADKLEEYKGINGDEAYDALVDNCASYLDSIIKDSDNYQLRMLAALYKEITSTPVEESDSNMRAEFLKEVMRDSRLGTIRDLNAKDEDFEAIDVAAQEEATRDPDANPEDTSQEATFDVSIRTYNEHGGIYSDYMTHVSQNIKALLDSIPKLNDYNYAADEPDYNLDNAFGIPDVYNANEVATILYHYGEYDDVASMIESIEEIAKSIPGYAGLKILADKLKANNDLALDFYRTFGKAVISKLETIVEGEGAQSRRSNQTSSRREVLRYTFVNHLKSTAIRLDLDFAKAELGMLKLQLGNKNLVDDKEADRFIHDLYVQLRTFYPSITENSISRFVKNNKIKGSVDRRKNFDQLTRILTNTIESSGLIKDKYDELQAARSSAYYKNKRLERENAETPGLHSADEFEDLDPLYSVSYVSAENQQPCNELADALLKYTAVRTNLNSRNVHGNQSSDVINNSMITNLMHTFESVLNNPDDYGNVSEDSPLMQFARHKFQSQQYDFGNMLLEKKDENGKIINYGLFYHDKDGRIKPTTYARQLLQFSLFNGASNMDDGTNVLYNEMSRGDYIGTAWINFFHEDSIDVDGAKISVAKYFLRIPSDAPKTFTLRAPKYSAKGFRTVVNQNEINQAIADEISRVTDKFFASTNVLFGDNPIVGYRKDKPWTNVDLLKHVRLDGTGKFTIPTGLRKNSKLKNGEPVTIALAYNVNVETSDEPQQVYYAISGTYNDGILENAKFEGFARDGFTSDIYIELRAALNDELKRTGEINGVKEQYKVNTKHQLYKQMRSAFVQELQDAATALDVMFERKELTAEQKRQLGIPENVKAFTVAREKGTHQLKYKRGNNTNHGHLNSIYHYDKSGNIVKGEIGSEKLTGKVFTSDRFTVYDTKTGKPINYGQQIIDEAIDFLYGGAIQRAFIYVETTEGKIEPRISPELEAKIEEKLNDWSNAYIESARERLNPMSGFLRGNSKLNTDNITEFAINHHLMYINSNDILEGDTKFYKDSQTFLKRAKEYQGSGVPYGIMSYRRGIDNLMGNEHIPSELDKFPELGIELRTKFRAVTIKNTIKTDDETIDRLIDQLVKESGLTREAAETLMRGPLKKGKRSGGFQDVTVNDAQSYITFDEWVRRITARGQFYKYKPLIDKILDPNSTLSAKDMEEFVQVQKNFYYDQHYNSDTRTIAPRQIKNAEFVIVPRFVQGTELEKVYDLMKKYNIDQLNTVETSKAAKSYELELFDSKTGLIKEDILAELADKTGETKSEFGQVVNDAIEEFDYNHLYTQQETPQHIDASNKAGIQIMKKILDNIDENSPLYDKKNEFFRLYSANIKESFTNLMKEFNVPLDANGNIKLNEDGSIDGLNYEVFYERLQEELVRLGLDSNMADYVTLDGVTVGSTVMPNYMSLVAQKLENIAQSLFNNRITRQLLPGFHAAQVTGVGFTSLAQRGIKGKAYSDKLRYHPVVDGKTQPYIEIMLPAAAFGFDINSESSQAYIAAEIAKGKTKTEAERALKDFWLEQLNNEKLGNIGTILGYRIPTEGKQSVCIMKVVDFTDDTLGSTIVVPDAWVAQTGSDFDIDSVYGIQYSTYIDKNGIIRRHEYKTSNEQLYMDYVRRSLGKEKWNEIFETSKLEKYEKDEIKAKFTDAEGNVDWDSVKANIKTESRKILQEELINAINANHLESFSEYNKRSIEERNTKKARDNQMLDIMKEILGHKESLEENLSRSNFDDVLDAFEKVLDIMPDYASQRASRSPYNFFDQAEYMEDAMSGAKLKAFSVTRDTFCSVCNTVKPTLAKNSELEIIYDFSNLTAEEYQAKLNNINENFDNVVEVGGQKIKVTHKTFGWTKKNKNVEGKILTAYSSQTTAHILDAIKSGNIPNVNDLTFAVYKTFVDVGSNYDTAVSFMMQPGVRRIVEAYNSSKSIYSESNSKNYVGSAIRAIAKELNLDISRNATIDDILAEINHKYGGLINKLFGTKGVVYSLEEEDIAKIPFNIELQFKRLSNELSSPVEGINQDELNAIYDLAIVLQYNKLSLLANQVGTAARVCNPDRFGAKQSIFATNDVFTSIEELATDDTFRLLVNKTNLIDAIYPGARKGAESFATQDDSKLPNQSAYPSLFAFLKYATATSILVNRQLFKTQEQDFVDYVMSIQEVLSDDAKVDEKTAKEFQNYIINALYRKVRFINQPLVYRKGVGFVYTEQDNGEPNLAEQARIYGYGRTPDLSLEYEEESFTYSEDVFPGKNFYSGRVTPDKNTIFVFGSNPKGIHGAGAAKVAEQQFGAMRGLGEGLINQSYALPTKDLDKARGTRWYRPGAKEEADVKEWYKTHSYSEVLNHPLNSERTISPQQIIESIKKLYEVAKQLPSKEFKIADYPLGELSLNGYLGEEMREMFRLAGPIPSNIVFNESWNVISDNQVTRTVKTVRRPFKIENPADPTVDEIKEFARLSPAQKVAYIQEHFATRGIFDYVKTTLSNDYATRNAQAGAQTLSFDEDAIDAETRYQLFYDAFTNKNPLIAMAAADMIKYAFVVEGYRMGMHNVSKMISNKVLVSTSKLYGTNFIQEMNEMMATVDEQFTEELKENFVRSHSTMQGINRRSVQKETTGGYELKQRGQGLIIIETNQAGKELAEKYGIIHRDKNGKVDKINKYVVLKFGKKPTLYKIKERGGLGYVLTPLNKLEANENDTWSVRSDNNIYPSMDKDGNNYYDTVISKYEDAVTAKNLSAFSASELMEVGRSIDTAPYKAQKTKKVKGRYGDAFRVHKDDQLGKILIKTVGNWFENSVRDGKPACYLINNALGQYITTFGPEGSIITSVPVFETNEKGEEVLKYKVPIKITKKNVKNLMWTYVKERGALDRPAPKGKEDLVAALRNFSAGHEQTMQTNLDNVYEITTTEQQVDPGAEVMFSTIDDVLGQGVQTINRRAYRQEDVAARKIAERWKTEGTVASDTNKKKNTTEIIVELAKYATDTAREINKSLTSFIEDPDNPNHYLSITDDKTLKLVKKNPEVRRLFLKTIMEPHAFAQQFSMIKELDMDSADTRTKMYLERIKKAVDQVENASIIATAREKYIHEYIDKISDNPLVRHGLISVIDGFYKTNFLNSWFNDIQETSNGLIQVTMKNVMRDIRAQEMEARRSIDKFVKNINAIKAEAKAAGKDFNFSHIIDEYGRFIQYYNDKFIEDRDRLQNAAQDAKIKANDIAKEKGKDSNEYIKAQVEWLKRRLEYNEWKAKYVHQPVVQEYYDKVNALERKILFGEPTRDEETGKIEYLGSSPYIYAMYQTLREERVETRNQFIDDAEDPELDVKLDELILAIRNLTSDYIINPATGIIEEKIDFEFEAKDEDEMINRARISFTAAHRLKDFVDARQAIEEQYFKYDPVYNFDEEVERYQAIVDKAERRDANDIPQASEYELANNEEYQKAKIWLRRNAIRQPIIDDETDWYNELKAAYEELHDDDKSIDYGKKYYDIVHNKKYKDELGQVNPMLLSKEDLTKLKEAQEANYKLKKEDPYSDRNLLSNKGKDDKIVYTSAFYRGLSGIPAPSATEKSKNPEWQKTVTEINNLLAPYYSESTQSILFNKILEEPNAEEILETLGNLYDKLHDFADEKRKDKTKAKRKQVREFVEKNVEFTTNEDALAADEKLLDVRKSRIKTLLNNVMYEIGYDGNRKPNRFLYQTVSLKLKNKDSLELYLKDDIEIDKTIDKEDFDKLKKFVDRKRTNAIRTIEKYTYQRPSRHYYTAEAEARSGRNLFGYNSYKEWFAANHIYNPNTNSFEPLKIWMVTSYKESLKHKWSPAFPQTIRTVRDGHYDTVHYGPIDAEDLEAAKEYHKEIDFRNTEYKEDGGHRFNYRRGVNPEYDTKIKANEYELKAAKVMQDVCRALAHETSAKKYFEKGWLPSKARHGERGAEFWKDEMLKTFGWNESATGYEDWYKNIDYYKDQAPSMPMLSKLKNKYIEDKKKELGSRPVREAGESEANFIARRKRWDEMYKAYQEEELKVQKELLEGDPVRAISEFILKASHYNAIQNNKYELFFAQQALRKYGVYQRRYTVAGPLNVDRLASTDKQAEYVKELDDNLIQQFDNQIRRLVYDQWKMPNAKLTKWMSTLQSFTSAKYMMMNVKGGIANVTLGESQILAEAFAREYFNVKQWAKGKGLYLSAMYDYIANAYKETSFTLQGAIIKFFDVVDYDEHTGLGHINTDPAVILERIRNAGYTPQTSGEHFMQNSALLTMTKSHRVVKNERAGEFGQPAFKIINFEEYIRDANEDALKAIVSADVWAKYKKRVEEISSDANQMKEFAWFRKDMTDEFAKAFLTVEERKALVKKKNDIRKEAKDKFNKLPDVYSQVELDKTTGKMTFKAGSLLASIDEAKADGSATDAMQLMANFKGRVIAVNKKIHGVYDKTGRAQVEKSWIGGLIMQYHKHLPVGIMKRYRVRGMFNEERGTVEKGVYTSIIDYLSIPFKRHQEMLGLTDKEVQTSIGVQNILKNVLDFISHPVLNFEEMPEYDKANIRRSFGDMIGALAALMVVIAIKAAGGDDEDDMWYNLALYEADRLATEATEYTPLFAPAAAKKLWTTPIAGMNVINDVMMSIQFIAQYLFDPDFDNTYQTGKYAGRDKISVRLENNIPIWRGIKSSFVDISENNKYYKVGGNLLTITGNN